MSSLEDLIEIENLTANHRAALEAFESAQRSGEPSLQTRDGVESLVLADGTCFLPTRLEDSSGDESWWSKVGAVLFAAGAMAGSAAWALRDERDHKLRMLVTIATIATVILIALSAWCLLRGRRAESKSRRVVYLHGMYLLRDALIERAGTDAGLCRVFPIERLARFDYRHVAVSNGGSWTLYVGCRLDSGEVEWVPTSGGNVAKRLETWLAGVREARPA